MPSKIWAVMIIILAFIGYDQWRSHQSFEQGYNTCQVESTDKIKEAVKAALTKERDTQGKINEGTQKQFDEVSGINARLNRELDRLRKRPDRASLPEAAKAQCKGVTGAYLSREDAGFLTREAAKADEYRTALKACYNYADSVGG